MTEPRWLDKTALLLLHAESLAEHGGLEGLRDQGLLESALARPLNLNAHEAIENPARLAAACAVGLARNYPFNDGKKRAAFLALGLFLWLNGWRLQASQRDATGAMFALAAGEISEEELATWIQQRLIQRR